MLYDDVESLDYILEGLQLKPHDRNFYYNTHTRTHI